MPRGPIVMRQRWEDLLFLHWEWDPAEVQRSLPAELTVDTWNGRAYIGFVPFFMRGVRPTGCPAVPGISNFLELNIRTYVRDREGRPGVWFYSLDCDQPLAVWVARTFFHLPYFNARMRATRDENAVTYECRRVGQHVSAAFRYEATGQAAPALAGSLEEFLVERYRLFSKKGEALLTGRVWHRPYEIRRASHIGTTATPMIQAGFDPCGRDPSHACFSPGVDVRIFPMSPA